MKVKGKMLERDFPLVARDWNPAANTRPLATVTAGAGFDAHWKCHRCAYEWVAQVAQRTCRQTRCARCYTERADGKNSLAVVHPELLGEWDAGANAPLRPDRIKATYDKAVIWRCRDDPTHPPYKMSPSTRAKMPTGCQICQKRRPRALGAGGVSAAA